MLCRLYCVKQKKSLYFSTTNSNCSHNYASPVHLCETPLHNYLIRNQVLSIYKRCHLKRVCYSQARIKEAFIWKARPRPWDADITTCAAISSDGVLCHIPTLCPYNTKCLIIFLHELSEKLVPPEERGC